MLYLIISVVICMFIVIAEFMQALHDYRIPFYRHAYECYLHLPPFT